jgi:hypothetical protein
MKKYPFLDRTPTRKKQDDYSGVAKPFNPLTFDSANLIALYNGDSLNPFVQIIWVDDSTNAFDLTLVGAPTRINGAINGHAALRFDGVSQEAQQAIISLSQPTTIYFVIKQITWTIGRRLFAAGLADDVLTVRVEAISPELFLFAGAGGLFTNPNIPLNTYDILTVIFNGANSVIRTNDNAGVIGNGGANNPAVGLNLASRGGIDFGNQEIAYLIIRSAADSTATQNLFINYLKNRFAL